MFKWEIIYIIVICHCFPLVHYAQDSIPDYSSLERMYFQAESYNYDSSEYAKADSIFNHIEELIIAHPGLDSSLTWVHYFLIYYERAFANAKLHQHYDGINFAQKALDLYYENKHEDNAGNILTLLDNLYDLITSSYKSLGLINKSLSYAKKSLSYAEMYDQEEDIIADYISIAELYRHFDERDSLSKYDNLCRSRINVLSGTKKAAYEMLYIDSKLRTTPREDSLYIPLLESYLRYSTMADKAYRNSVDYAILTYKADLNLLKKRYSSLETLFKNNEIPALEIHNKSDISLNKTYLKYLVTTNQLDLAYRFGKRFITEQYEGHDVVDWIFVPYNDQNLMFLAEYILLMNKYAEKGVFIPEVEIKNLLNHYENCLYAYILISSEDIDAYDQLSIVQNHLEDIVDMCALYHKNKYSPELEEFFFTRLSALKSISFIRYATHLHSHIDSCSSKSILAREMDYIHRISSEVNHSEDHEIESLRLEFSRFLDKLKDSYPEYYKVRYNKGKVNLSSTRKTLAQHDLDLLNINIGKHFCINHHVTQEGIVTSISELYPAFHDDISRIIEISEKRIGISANQQHYYDIVEEYYNKSYAINSLLFQEIELHPSRTIAIMSSPFLQGLNIGQLCKKSKSQASKKFSDLRYLIQDNTLVNLFAINQLGVEKNSEKQKPFLYIRPSYVFNAKLGSGSYIQRVIKEMGGEILTDKNASAEAFKKQFDKFKIIHFAGHSESHISRPEHSSLILSGTEGEEAIRGDEMSLMRSDASLLFMSSCNSYGKKVHVSEGVTGLARYIAFTGVKNIISTQWTVKDLESQEFAMRYYDHILSGESLRNSFGNMVRNHLDRKDPVLSHPYYWAAYNFHGYGDEAIVEQSSFGRNSSMILIISAAIGVFLLLWVSRRKFLGT